VEFDLRGRSLEEIQDFVFAHPVPTIRDESGWWWEAVVEFDPAEYATRLTEIFRHPAALRALYTREELEQGFWMLISGADTSLEPLFWDTAVPWQIRDALIKATVDLYEKLFAFELLDTSVYMFWDALAYGYCVPTRYPETDSEDRRIQNAMFSALTQILRIDSITCQMAALHGLGHLRHPDTESAIKAYLASIPTLADEHRQFALACISGNVQ
jgi:hypothetical protein